MIWTLFLDCLIAGLLVVAIVLATILNRRFAGLSRDRAQFAQVADEFHHAVARAEDSVARLKSTTAELEAENRRALQHEDDLRLLIERADTAADRLETAVRSARPASGERIGAGAGARIASKNAVPAKLAMAGVADGGDARSEAERDLLQALRFKR